MKEVQRMDVITVTLRRDAKDASWEVQSEREKRHNMMKKTISGITDRGYNWKDQWNKGGKRG